ncbi:MAG TPA: ribosome maturation factor RimM [Clostridia bacterium]
MDKTPVLREIVHIGRITSPHGIRGEVRVLPLTESPDRFDGLERCYLVAPDEKSRKEIDIRSVRMADRMLLVSLADVDSRDQAKALNGCFLSVDRDQAIQLPPGRHFIFDLIGCEVFDREAGRLGLLQDILQTGANDVYVVKRTGEKDLLIPVTRQVVCSVDIAARRIEVTLPDGLLEIYE